MKSIRMNKNHEFFSAFKKEELPHALVKHTEKLAGNTINLTETNPGMKRTGKLISITTHERESGEHLNVLADWELYGETSFSYRISDLQISLSETAMTLMVTENILALGECSSEAIISF